MRRAVKLLVLGIGNPSRTDDGVGHYIVEQVESYLGRYPIGTSNEHSGRSERLGIQTARVQQLTPELSLDIKDFDVVVFVDAHVGCGGESPNTVDLSPVTPDDGLSAVSHHWTAGSLLALTAQLCGHAPQGYMLSVVGRDFDFSTVLSPQTRQDADVAVERLIEFIGQQLQLNSRDLDSTC